MTSTSNSFWWGVMLTLAISQTIHAWHVPTKRNTPTWLASSTNNAPPAAEGAVRAGEAGYSVMRQPVDWDPNKDPEFDVPLSQDDALWNDDAEWWSRGGEHDSTTDDGEYDEDEYDEAAPRIEADESELDLFQRSWDTLDFGYVLRALKDECLTVPAKLLIEEARPLTGEESSKTSLKNGNNHIEPLMATTVTGSQERYAAVREWQHLRDDKSRPTEDKATTFRTHCGKRLPLSVIPLGGHNLNIEDILDDTATRVLQGPDLLELWTVLNVLTDITLWQAALPVDEVPQLTLLASAVEVNATLHELLDGALDDQGRLSGQTFPVIGRLRAQLRALKTQILGTLETLLDSPSLQSKLSLQSGGPRYSQVTSGRLVVPVSTAEASRLGIVHDTSRSGKTSFVEPTELVGPTNELQQLERDLRTEEARIWRYLTAQVHANRESLRESLYAAAQLDLVLARTRLGDQWVGTVPDVQNGGVIIMKEAKHPVLLLRALRKQQRLRLSSLTGGNSNKAAASGSASVDSVVGSDLVLGDQHQGLVLTGPNSGGKTVILKQLGLAALMARCGIPLPCEASPDTRVDFFDPILADIGDLQSVNGDLSTFSGHMLVCKQVLDRAQGNYNSNNSALVLMDELGSGTDPNQGVAIAQALLEALVDTGARVAITTHYTELKQLAASDPRFAVGGMEFVRGRPTYKLLPGLVGESFALSVAERVGLSSEVLERANQLLNSETREMGELLGNLQDQKATLEEKADDLAEQQTELRKLQATLRERENQLEQQMLRARRDEAQKFAKKLAEKEQVLEGILAKLRSDPSRKVVAKSWDEIKVVKREAMQQAEQVPSVVKRQAEQTAAMDQARAELIPLSDDVDYEAKAGDKLVVIKEGPMFGREATVFRRSGGKIEVKINSMSVAFKLADVARAPTAGTALVNKFAKKKPQPVKKGGASSVSKAAARALDMEGATSKSTSTKSASEVVAASKTRSVAIRTDSNTVDVRGLNLEQAKDKARSKFSASLMTSRSTVYILHGHGTGGVLKKKVRGWLQQQQQQGVVKTFTPAGSEDGGDAFTKVELR